MLVPRLKLGRRPVLAEAGDGTVILVFSNALPGDSRERLLLFELSPADGSWKQVEIPRDPEVSQRQPLLFCPQGEPVLAWMERIRGGTIVKSACRSDHGWDEPVEVGRVDSVNIPDFRGRLVDDSEVVVAWSTAELQNERRIWLAKRSDRGVWTSPRNPVECRAKSFDFDIAVVPQGVTLAYRTEFGPIHRAVNEVHLIDFDRNLNPTSADRLVLKTGNTLRGLVLRWWEQATSAVLALIEENQQGFGPLVLDARGQVLFRAEESLRGPRADRLTVESLDGALVLLLWEAARLAPNPQLRNAWGDAWFIRLSCGETGTMISAQFP
ncbi:MAG: hypothetical protein Kow00109_26610 [Acidobacteriota bacterium]